MIETIVYLTPEVMEEIKATFILARPSEAMFLLWSHIEGRDIVVDQCYFPYQETNSGYCEVSKEGHIKMGPEVGIERFGTINGLIHSHGKMKAFHSTTDQKWLEQFQNKQTEYVVSIVFGKDDEMVAQVDLYKPLEASIKATVKIVGEDDYLEKYRPQLLERMSHKKPPKTKDKPGKVVYKGNRFGYNQSYMNGFFGDFTETEITSRPDSSGLRFDIENPEFNADGNPMCCNWPMVEFDMGDSTALYCQTCFNEAYVTANQLKKLKEAYADEYQ